MTKTVQAVYTNGVLRPLQPLDLPDNQQLTLTITNGAPADEALLDTEFLAYCAQEADPSVTLEAVRTGLAQIPGSLTDDFVAERDER